MHARCVQLILTLFLNLIWLQAGHAQNVINTSIPQAKWIYKRGPADPRPYKNALFNSLIFKDPYFDMKNKLWIEKGISYGGYISANIQGGSEGGSSHQISETLVLFTWEPVRKEKSAGRLVVGLAHDRTFGKTTTRIFADRQNLVETPNDLDTNPELTFTTLGLFHWTHEWRTGPDGGWGIRIGQLYAPSYFGPARYLDDDRRFFMARPLAAAGGAQWVGYNDIGLGVNGVYWKTPIYFSVAAIDAKANRKYPDFGSLADGELLYLVEAGLEWDVNGPNEKAIRVTFSHLDLQDALGPGQSLMISGNLIFDNIWGIAGRYSRSFRRFTADYRELASLAFLWELPYRRSDDLAGIGVFTGKPSDPDKNWESGFELFYKLQLTNGISFAPDLQYWLRKDTDDKVRTWVLGFRSEIEF